ncbi:PREDICTED: uncharacterized protein LOC106809957 [Priapulus caudatus]|uniref:Uncharacterized protein LOC106809957 n=1 Tax=Priapulus caudatus TaxID=37621 RepID=A0ABM1E914_PRICU|nr:PREDICTED: uncharacterized protein LOC106809957 [Priapulus caudatus]
MADNVAQSAAQGHYTPADEAALEKKARAIAECYLDSLVHPRVQVNISTDMADGILDALNSGMVDRGLFHVATMSIFTVLVYEWKKFCRHRFSPASAAGDGGCEKKKLLTPHPSFIAPDYLRMDINSYQKQLSQHEDDPPRLSFSLTRGLRKLIPLPKEFDGGDPPLQHTSRMSMTTQDRHAFAPANPGRAPSTLINHSRAPSTLINHSRAPSTMRGRRMSYDRRGLDAAWEDDASKQGRDHDVRSGERLPVLP